MSVRALFWAMQQKLPPRDKLVLLIVADHYNDDQDAAWMKQNTLAERTGYNRTTVLHALNDLEHKHGILTSKERRYPDGRNASKVYKLHFDSVAETNSGHASVAETNTDSVAQTNTDRVAERNNKNLKHRTSNIEQIHSSAKPTSVPFDEYLQAWNNNCGNLRKAMKLNQWRKQKITAHHRENKQEALHMFTLATQQVALNEYWNQENYGIDTLLRNKILTYYEQAQAQQTTLTPTPLVDFTQP